MSNTTEALAAAQERWEQFGFDGAAEALITALLAAARNHETRLAALSTQESLVQSELADAILDLRERVVALEKHVVPDDQTARAGGMYTTYQVERIPADPAPDKPAPGWVPLGELLPGTLHVHFGLVWLKTAELRDDGAICCYIVGDRHLGGDQSWVPPETLVREVPVPVPGDDHA